MSQLEQNPGVRQPLADVVWRLVEHIGRLGAGDVADLRRGRPCDPTRPALWRLLTTVVEPAGHLPAVEGQERDTAERAWAMTCWAIAAAGPTDCRRGSGLGRTLLSAGVSELRLVRFLRAGPDRLEDEVRGVISQIASKGEPLHPVDLCRLILSAGRDDEDEVRRDIARSYFAQERAQRQH